MPRYKRKKEPTKQQLEGKIKKLDTQIQALKDKQKLFKRFGIKASKDIDNNINELEATKRKYRMSYIQKKLFI